MINPQTDLETLGPWFFKQSNALQLVIMRAPPTHFYRTPSHSLVAILSYSEDGMVVVQPMRDKDTPMKVSPYRCSISQLWHLVC